MTSQLDTAKQKIQTLYGLISLIAITILAIAYITHDTKRAESDVVDLVACNYPDDFLSSEGIGLKNKEYCQSVFTAQHKKYVDECGNSLYTSKLEEREVKRLIDKCIYISIEKDQLPLLRDYEIYLSREN